MTADTTTPGAPDEAPRAAPKRRKLLLKQKNMLRMLAALSPLVVAAVYFFGWRAAAVLAAVSVLGVGTEWLTSRQRGQPISTACFVTCWLYGLSLPPTVPFWIAAVGIVVAILFGKEVFGGFGRNFANPAIVGRAFVYICFPTALTAQFVPVFKGFPAGLAEWSWTARSQLPAYLKEQLRENPAAADRKVTDALSTATPMVAQRDVGLEQAGIPLSDLLLGSIGQTYQEKGRTKFLSAGSMGEGCKVLILLGAVFLLATKTANWRLMLSALVGLAAATGLFRHLLGFRGLGGVPPLPFALLAGTTLYATVFMVTDPVSAPKKPPAMVAYGFGIGFLIVLLRWRGVFAAAAASFAILLGNMVAPLLDMGADAWAARAKRRSRPAKGGAR